MIGFIIYIMLLVIGYSLIRIVVQAMHNRQYEVKKLPDGFLVELPPMLRYVFIAFAVVGVLLLLFFLLTKAEKGNFIFAFLFIAIGLLVMMKTYTWTVRVSSEGIHYSAFFVQKAVPFHELDVRTDESGSLFLYAGGRRFRTIEPVCTGYKEITEILKEKQVSGADQLPE